MDRTRGEMNPNRRFTIYLINIILLSAVTICAVAAALIMYARLERTTALIEEGEAGSTVRLQQVQEQAAREGREEVLGEIRESLEAGESTTSMLRSLFPGEIMAISGGRYFFTPIGESVPERNISRNELVFEENGTVRYTGLLSGVTVHRGIDVSERNGDIEWARAAENGISFVMVRLGYIDAEGEIREDRRFARNFAGALQNGIRVGCYMEVSGAGEGDILAQARFFADTMEPYGSRISCPAALRVILPEGGEEEARSRREKNTAALEKACSLLEEKGYTPMIAGDLAALSLSVDLSGLDGRDIWYAGADESLAFPYQWTMWQYRSGVRIEGIQGDVELDLYVTQE